MMQKPLSSIVHFSIGIMCELGDIFVIAVYVRILCFIRFLSGTNAYISTIQPMLLR